MALLRRERTGLGDYIDISMHDVTVGGMLNILGPAFAENRQPIPAHERTTGGAAFYRPYETQDGRYLVLAGQEPKFIHNLLGAFGRPDLAELCLRGPGPHQRPVMDFLAAEFRQKAAGRVERLSCDARRLLRLRQHAPGSACASEPCLPAA